MQMRWRRTLGDSEWLRLNHIYEDSFPPEERVSLSALREGVGAGKRSLLTAETTTDLLGFATVFGLPALATAYLEFLAVAPDERNAGLGGSMLDFMVLSLRDRGTRAIIFEVESDTQPGASDICMRRRRIGFYQRHGASLVGCAPAYRAPDLTGGGSTPMRLMWLPISPLAPQPSGELLRGCIAAMYTGSYARPPDDPLLRSVLAELVC